MAIKDWKVPRTKVHLVNRRLRKQIEEAFDPILYEDWWESQRIVLELEKRFGEEMGYPYTSAVQSGAAGLRLALLACGIKAGDEVITVANSDMATTASISQSGATPVLCDVQRSDHVLNPDLIEPLINEKTRAILPVDLYGHPADVRRMREIADRHGLYIIEDAAIATGAVDYGKPVGAFADLAVFSTCSSKPFPSAGGGGLVVSSRHDLWEKIEILKGYGRRPEENLKAPVRYDHILEGYNLRMLPFDAALLLLKLPYLKEWSQKRRRIAAKYIHALKGLNQITLPVFRSESEPIYRTFTICIEKRDELYNFLREKGINAALNYVPPVHLQTVYRDRRIPGSDHLPVSEYLSDRLLGLPVDPDHTDNEIAYVCEQIHAFYDVTNNEDQSG